MGVWVNQNKYSPGKRHYYPGTVERTILKTETIERGDRTYERTKFIDQVVGGSALCGHVPMRNEGNFTKWDDRRKPYSYGGLSAKEKVNLLQSNLCSYCKKALLESRPELKALVEQMKALQL